MSPRPNTQHLRRPHVVAAAAEVIRERGLLETRISDIAEVLGASQATVLYYFETKDKLLEAAVEHADRESYEHLVARMASLERASDKLVCLFEEVSGGADGAAGDWTLWLEVWVRARRDPELRASYPRLDRPLRTIIADVVRQGQEDGEFDPSVDAADVALSLAALLDGLGIQLTLGHEDLTPARMVDRCVEIASKELGCPLRPGVRTGAEAREESG